MNKLLLFVPGPVNLPSASLRILGRTPSLHYGKEWASIYHDTQNILKKIINTKFGKVFLLPGVGTLGIDSVLHNILANKTKILVISNGFFGEQLEIQARYAGGNVNVIKMRWDESINPDDIEKILKKKKYDIVALVHHETSSGILNPIKEICSIANKYGCLTLVDAVSSAGGVPIRFDDWGIDFLITVSNKCLEGIHGVSPIVISTKGMMAIKNTVRKVWYLDFLNWDEFDTKRFNEFPHPSTMPTNAIRVLNYGMKRILNRGLERHYFRYIVSSQKIRKAIQDVGLKILVNKKNLGPLLTPIDIQSPEDYKLIAYMKKNNILIGGGLGKYKGKCVRVANMGMVSENKHTNIFIRALTNYYNNI